MGAVVRVGQEPAMFRLKVDWVVAGMEPA